MKSKDADRSQHHAETYMNDKQRSNEHYQTMIYGTLERIKQTGMMEHNTTINSIQCVVQFDVGFNARN